VTLALVLLALWVLLLLPVLALCKAAALGDQISASLLPVREGDRNRKNVALGGNAARGRVWSER
jgi:hypothetical protein